MPRKKTRIRSKEYRKRKRKALLTKAGITAGIVLIVVGLLAWGSHAEALSITAIDVEGNKVTSKREVREVVNKTLEGSYLYIFSKQNSIIYPRTQVIEDIKNRYKRIQSAEVKLADFSTLSITIEERSPVALWCKGAYKKEKVADQACYYVDQRGYIYSRAPQFSGDVFLRFYGGEVASPVGSQYLTPEVFLRTTSFIDAVENRLDLNAVAFEIENDTDARVVLARRSGESEGIGGAIRFDYTDDLRTIFENLKTVVQKKVFADEMEQGNRLEYIDLRFGNKVYYKFLGSDEEETAD